MANKKRIYEEMVGTRWTAAAVRWTCRLAVDCVTVIHELCSFQNTALTGQTYVYRVAPA